MSLVSNTKISGQKKPLFYFPFCIPAIFFLFSLFLDNLVTAKGTEHFLYAEKEGNPIVRGIWTIMGEGRWLAPLLWAVAILFVSFLLYRIHQKTGLWLLYAVGIGHSIGFLTWKGIYLIPFASETYFLILLVVVSSLVGLACVFVEHVLLPGKRNP